MNTRLGALALALHTLSVSAAELALVAQKEALLERVATVHEYNATELAALRDLVMGEPYLGQGNPAITEHAASRETCTAARANQPQTSGAGGFALLCADLHMAPLFDPATQTAQDATACIDQYEFPNIPCEFPVVWVRAATAARICEALGKRLCDAHEWEGACEGALRAPDYRFDLAAGVGMGTAVARMQSAHNRAHAPAKRWSYGPAYRKGVCAAASHKSSGCPGGGWSNCGSNTYPAGHFPQCVSALGVYDLHGNAAEHMNLPLAPAQMASAGSTALGVTEMKGSWFIFDRYYAHPDWCRWRAPFWHGSRVRDAHSHENYHLGFRCCKTLPAHAQTVR
jgi:hypothetical protein